MWSEDIGGLLLPLGLAVVMGLTIGIERSIRGRPAGLRTYLLVCVSFAVIALLSESHYLAADASRFRPDPARLAAGGLTGIGFLGAGVIVRSRYTVYGLTTAAGIWTVAVIGLTLGSRNYDLAVVLYVLAMVSLGLLRYVEPVLPRQIFRQIVLRMHGEGMSAEESRQFFAKHHLTLERLTIERDKQTQTTRYVFGLRSTRPQAFVDAFNDLLPRQDVQYGQLVQQVPREWDEAEGNDD
jgi:putative Mg2+ transporter-C (MgtC) family protein